MLTRFRPRFGYGTLIALAVVAALWWSGLLKPQEPNNDLRVAYEADRSGKLRRVDTPTASSPTPRWQVKEPRLLLQHAEDLGLTDDQRNEVQRIAQAWEREEKRWLETIQREQTRAQQEMQPRDKSAVPYTALRQSLQGYSELSRAYAQARAQAWQQALAVLSPQQRERAKRLFEPS